MELSSPEFRISTRRLILRPMTMADETDLFQYQSDPDVVRYIPWPERTREQVHTALVNALAVNKLESEGDYALLGIVLPTENKVIGQMALMYSSNQNQAAEFGYVLNPAYGGHGYATEASRAVVDYLFGTGKFHRVFAKLDPRNSASEELLRRLGFRKEAHLKEEELFKGEWVDTLIYGILEPEWAQSKGRINL
jgi:RimJ/RimL family protein N-acetyltransferase